MRSVLHALIWDSYRYTFWLQLILLAVCLLPLAIFASIAGIYVDLHAGDPVMYLLEVSLLPFVIFILLLGAATGHAKLGQLSPKPLSNLSIAAWRLIGGSVLLAMQVGLVVGIYNTVYQAGWPLVGAVLFTVAMWFVAQPFCCLADKSITGALITIIPMALMSIWFITRYEPIGGGRRDWNEINASETLQLLTVMGLCAWSTLGCVALARRGDGLTLPTWLSHWFRRTCSRSFADPNQPTPFRSARHAMFWYEWRWKGWPPTASMLLLVAIIVPARTWHSSSLASYTQAVTEAYAGTMLPVVLLGVLYGLQLESLPIALTAGVTKRLNEVDQLGSFQATRPVSDAQLSYSQLWACLASIGLVTGLWCVLAVPAYILATVQGQLHLLTADHQLSLVPTVALSMWIVMSNLAAIASTGRTKLLASGLVGLALAFVGLLTWLEWLGNKNFEQLVLRIAISACVLTLAACTGWSLTRCRHRQFISRVGATSLLTIALLIFIIGCGMQSDLNSISVAAVGCVSILSILPWVTTPLANSWNRHR